MAKEKNPGTQLLFLEIISISIECVIAEEESLMNSNKTQCETKLLGTHFTPVRNKSLISLPLPLIHTIERQSSIRQ
ncbi:hypothetical protein TNCV_5096851 [Trichonephila clavipes]|nr:hypothetical protein TNCV_5096851 [Trichonephila clavipes]